MLERTGGPAGSVRWQSQSGGRVKMNMFGQRPPRCGATWSGCESVHSHLPRDRRKHSSRTIIENSCVTIGAPRLFRSPCVARPAPTGGPAIAGYIETIRPARPRVKSRSLQLSAATDWPQLASGVCSGYAGLVCWLRLAGLEPGPQRGRVTSAAGCAGAGAGRSFESIEGVRRATGAGGDVPGPCASARPCIVRGTHARAAPARVSIGRGPACLC